MTRKSLTVLMTLAAIGAGAAPAAAVSGGQDASGREAPWMVTIASKGDAPLDQRAFCGGVLITPNRVATAAHCVDESDPNGLEVHLGGTTLSTDPGRTVQIAGYATHPDYHVIPSPNDPDNFLASGAANDVAIIQLAQPQWDVPFLRVARNTPKDGAPVEVYGHGLTESPLTDPQGALGDTLQRGDLNVISDSDCNAELGGVVDGKSVLCAQSTETTVCSGDSGGPVVRDTPWGRELVGIVSFAGEVISKLCGDGGYANAFADTAELRNWLLQPFPTLAPMPRGELEVVGERTVGSTLTCQLPEWLGKEPDSVEIAWDKEHIEEDGSPIFLPIEGETQSTLTVTEDLAANRVLCVVYASTAGGTVRMVSEPV